MKNKTVKIQNEHFPEKFIRINESDFDKSKHKLFVEKSEVEKDGAEKISLVELQELKKDELLDYAKKVKMDGLTGKSKEEIFEAIKNSGNIIAK